MSGGNYSITTRASGTILTATIYNADHQNHVDNNTPQGCGGYSANQSQMQTQTDPGSVGSESFASSVAGELERIRFAIARLAGSTFWYTPAPAILPGLANRIINGDMRIDQRNAGGAQTFVAAAVYASSVDRMLGSTTGANANGQRVAGSGADQFLYQFTGAASVTGLFFAQRIEATNIYDLASTTATLSVELQNSLLTAVTWAAYYANAVDNWSAKTQIATGTFTVNNTLTRYNAQIALPANTINGVMIELSVGAQISGTWKIGELQLEPGSVARPFERRPIGMELALCQRYYEVGTVSLLQVAGQAGSMGQTIPFKVTKRTTPNVVGTPSALGNATGGTVDLPSTQDFRAWITASAIGQASATITWVASIEL